MHVTILKRVSCVVVNYGVYHFKSRWLETVDRFGHSELLPGTKIFVRTIFLFTGEVIYCLIVKTHFKRPSLCDYQVFFIRIHFSKLARRLVTHSEKPKPTVDHRNFHHPATLQ